MSSVLANGPGLSAGEAGQVVKVSDASAFLPNSSLLIETLPTSSTSWVQMAKNSTQPLARWLSKVLGVRFSWTFPLSENSWMNSWMRICHWEAVLLANRPLVIKVLIRSIRPSGPSKPEIKFITCKDGSVECNWTPKLPGEYKIFVRYEDKEITGSPFKCKSLIADW